MLILGSNQMPDLFPNIPVDRSRRMHSEGNDKYWFFHYHDFPADPPLVYQQLVTGATSQIDVWDPYFNIKPPERDQDIFFPVGQNITIQLLTLKGLSPASTYFNDIANELKAIIPRSKNTRLGIRAINMGDTHHDLWHFHDRFLIIDRREVFLVGSSITSHLRPLHSTGIYRLTDVDTASFIVSLFDSYWNKAINYAYANRYLHI
jgi:hypothetical protein